MNLFQFMSDSPVLTFALFFIVLQAVVRLCMHLLTMITRHYNIKKNGYPPPHCDADGDFKE